MLTPTRDSVSEEEVRPGPRPTGGERTWFEELFDRSADAIFILDADTGRVLEVNETALQMFAMTREEATTLSVDDFSAGEAPYAGRDAVEWLAKSRVEGPQMFEWLSRRRNGQLFWTEVALRYSEIGGQPLVLAQVRDICGRKQTEEDLANTQQLLQSAIEQSPIGVVVADAPTATIRLVNGAALRIWGDVADPDPEASMAAQSEHWKAFRPDGRRMKAVDCPLSQSVVEGRTCRNVEMIVQRPDGENRHVLTSSAPVRDSRGQIMAGVMVVSDVTEQRLAQLELDRFFNLSLDLLSISGFDGHHHRVNPAFERLLGWTQEEIREKPWLSFVHPDDQKATQEVTTSLIEGRPVIGFVNRYRCRDGTFRWLSWSAFPFPEDQVIICVARDITEWRDMQERLRQTEKMEAIGQLAGGIAHDFNNQLCAIMGYADLLVQRLAEPALNRYAQGVLEAARRASDLTRSLLAFARRGKYQTVRIDVHALVAEVVMVLERSIDKRISLRQDLRAREHDVVGDPTQLQSALLNLGLNARDAMPGGGRLVFRTDTVDLDHAHPRSHLADLAPGRYLRIRISDTGTGMTEDVKKRIFDPFFTTKPAGKGAGMGLPSVYGTIRSHEGAVRVASRPGRGTTMTLYLPVAEAPRKDAPSGRPPRPRRQACIMVVDDEESSREVLAEILKSGGHGVSVCQDGVEAVERYAQDWEKIDAVILDMVMPRMSGPDTFAALRKINPRAKVIIASGYSLEGAAQDLLDRGAAGFLQKPFKCAQLLEKLAAVL